MASTFRAIEVQWDVPREGGGMVTATRAVGSTVIEVDRTQAAPVPRGARLLSAFLDEFEGLDDIAPCLPEVRNEISRNFADRDGVTIKSLRLARGFSQSDLANAIGSSQSHVSRLESRKEKPNEDTIRALCGALAIDANTIMDALARADR